MPLDPNSTEVCVWGGVEFTVMIRQTLHAVHLHSLTHLVAGHLVEVNFDIARLGLLL